MNDFTDMYCATTYKIVSAELTADGRMEIVKQYPSNASYANIGGGVVPDKVMKVAYGVVKGKIEMIKIIEGTHTPGYNVAESIKFPKV